MNNHKLWLRVDSLLRCSRVRHCNHNHHTCDQNTTVLPAPMTYPTWSQHTYQYLSIEYLIDQKLENVSSKPNSPMSNANFQEEPTIMIPLEWPSQQSIPEPSHMQSPEPMEFNPYPIVPSNYPLLELMIHEDPLSPSSSLGKCSASPSSTVSQP